MRIDKGLKTQSQKILDSMGLDMTSAFTIFLKEVVRTGAIPFIVRSDYCTGKMILSKEDFEDILDKHRMAVESGDFITLEQLMSKNE